MQKGQIMKIHLLLINTFFSVGIIYAAQWPTQRVETPKGQGRQLSALERLPKWDQLKIAQDLNYPSLASLVRVSRTLHDNLAETLESQSARAYWTRGKFKEKMVLAGVPNSWIASIAFSPDGTRLASARGKSYYDNTSTVILWDVLKGKKIKELVVHNFNACSVAFSPNGKILACGLDDGTVRLWNVQTDQIRVLAGHTEAVYALAFSADGNLLASGSNDMTIRLWGRTNR